MDDDTLWKRRFHIFVLVRLIGLVLFLLGIGIAFSDWIRPGGMSAVGIPLALIGLATSVMAPRLLKRHWDAGHE